MSGGFDAIADIGLSDIVSSAQDLGTVVTDFGTEYMSSFNALSAFEVPAFDVASLGGFGEVGSLAGSASWFDTFNSGSILSSIPSVSDFSLSSLTGSLPSLSGLKDIGSTLTDISGTIQKGLQAYNKVAPLVNTASSALGIQNPFTAIIQPLNQAAGIAGSAAGISRSLSNIDPTNLNVNSLVSSGAASLGINPPAVQAIGKLATSTSTETDAYGLNILSAADTAQLTKNINPAFINSLVDPNTPKEIIDPKTGEITYASSPVASSTIPSALNNYNSAVATVEALAPDIEQYQLTISQNDAIIAQENAKIASAQLELQNSEVLTDARRTELETQINSSYDTIAILDQQAQAAQINLDNANTAVAYATQVIAQTDTSAIKAATSVNDSYYTGVSTTTNTVVGTPGTLTNINITNLVQQARSQQTLRNQTQTKAQSTDWRVKLRLAPNSTYLYNDPNGAGILAPLSAKDGTDGIIFPYTPSIETAYKANYSSYDLTHSNFRGYFYQSSYVDALNMRCTFTAQDTNEANYLLAVIHFFRSVTKMFYGKDTERGSPPPLVFLSGLGTYQFNEHPCVVSQFNYTLPPDVDYIRARSLLNAGTNLLDNRTRTNISGNPLSYGINRLLNSGLFQGAVPTTVTVGNLPAEEPTYVPTKIEISVTLLPIQSRQQVSTQFSLKGFANGNLLKGGFW